MRDTLEGAITTQKLLDAADTLSSLSEAFSNLQMPDEDQSCKAASAGISCSLVMLICAELAKHLNDGKELFEALRATARGELPIPPGVTAELQRLNDPKRHN
jgi:hypothetical protein